MRHLKILIVSSVLTLSPTWGGWVRLANFYGHATGPGTAIAAGRGLETGSPTPDATTLVWLLHGRDSDEINFFERWHAPSGLPGSWARRQNLPWEDPRRDKVDWGGALVYAPDPTAQAGCRLFAFTGNGTSYFWEYDPYYNKWKRLEDCPQPVGEGGSLCYGGAWEINGVPYVFIYAFAGNGSQRFFRYAYPLVPTKAPLPRLNGWSELAPMVAPVKGGGGLAWLALPNNPAYPRGVVVAMRGERTKALYFYDPELDRWSWRIFENLEEIGMGSAIAADASGEEVWFWCGRHTKFYRYNFNTNSLAIADSTPMVPQWGAALCQAGDTFYAVFGRDNEPQFWCYCDSQEPDGGQSGGRTSALPSVMLLPSGREYQIVVNDVSGSVNLTVFSVAGTVMKRLSECPISGRCVLRLDTGHWQTGIYYWRLETSAGVTAGKVTVIH